MTQTAERKDTGRRASKGSGPEGSTSTPGAKPGRNGRRKVGDTAGGTPRSSGSGRRDGVAVGAEPRVHLLPPEVLADRKAAVIRSRLLLGVVAVIALTVLGILGAGALAVSAQRDLAAEQATTQQLLKQQLQYVKVRAVQQQLDLIKTAQEVGASTEIAWTPYLQKVQATLPPNVTITGVAVDSSTPIELYPQSTASLQGPRVATIVFTAQSPSLPEVPSWLIALKTLPGYADALPDSVNLDSSGTYTVTITMHVDEKAFSNRFSTKQNTEK
ncbi:hypothetical protein ABIC47_000442 [Leifsonia sp. 563]|uniref:hypothetical protein n=1 Tax=Leifsonia sp. 563 TaxID=3156412 RepID=UPI0033916A31